MEPRIRLLRKSYLHGGWRVRRRSGEVTLEPKEYELEALVEGPSHRGMVMPLQDLESCIQQSIGQLSMKEFNAPLDLDILAESDLEEGLGEKVLLKNLGVRLKTSLPQGIHLVSLMLKVNSQTCWALDWSS